MAVELSATGGAPSLTAPASSGSGFVQISFKNSGQGPVSLEILGVSGNQTAQEVSAVFAAEGGPLPDWLSAAGGIGGVPPGQTGTVTVALDAGRYVFYAASSGGDGGGPPPATANFEVSGDGGGSLPSTGASITAKDYAFETAGLKPGKNEITFKNDGPKQVHHAIAFPLNEGATIEQAKAFFATDGPPTGPPPVDFEGGAGTGILDPDEELVTTVDLRAGKYAVVCFIQDRAGGPPHLVSNNMITEVTVAP